MLKDSEKLQLKNKNNPIGRSGFYWLGKKRSPETKEKIRNFYLGKTYEEIMGKEKAKQKKEKLSKNHAKYWLGKKRSPETIKKMIKGKLGCKHTKKSKEKISKNSAKIWLGQSFSKINKHNLSLQTKKNWQNDDYVKMMCKSRRMKPNKSEIKLDKLLQKYFPKEYKYVGDGKQGSFFGKIPDWINVNGQKKIIEHNGDYWHGEKITGRTKKQEEQQRIDHFTKFGYKTLIIWENELKDETKLLDKIDNFNRW